MMTKMHFYILVTFATIVTTCIADQIPKCITIRGKRYEEEELRHDIQIPFQLAIDYETNTLFFSHTVKTDEVFKIDYLNLQTRRYGSVQGIIAGSANAVNSKSHEVYMGGEDGLYKFDYKTKTATKINGTTDANIWQMFYKNGLFYSTYPDERAFLYDHNHVIEISEIKNKVTVIAVKNNGNYVYANDAGLYTYDKTSREILYMGDYDIKGITSDIEGRIYFSSVSAIYAIDDDSNNIEQIFTSDDNIFGLAVESNGNIIYAKKDNILRLKPSKRSCVIYSCVAI